MRLLYALLHFCSSEHIHRSFDAVIRWRFNTAGTFVLCPDHQFLTVGPLLERSRLVIRTGRVMCLTCSRLVSRLVGRRESQSDSEQARDKASNQWKV